MLTFQLISQLQELTIINVGSRVSEEDSFLGWGKLLGEKLRVIGFDADEDACIDANARANSQQWREEHIPLILSDKEDSATLYVTKNLYCTSLLVPNLDYLSQFPNFAKYFEVDYTVEVATTTLDAWAASYGLSICDFIKIDVQGADLAVLQGAANLLSSVLAVKVEVSFTPMYVGQPLFDDVNRWLLSQGFTFFDFDMLGYYPRLNIDIPSRHQLLWADAYYFKLANSSMPKSQLIKLAIIADLLQFHELAAHCLSYLKVATSS